MLLPCRLGPIRAPLWNHCNDASFSVLYSCSDWWSRTSPELHHSVMPFPLPPSAVDPDKGQEQRLCVGETYCEDWRAAKIRSPPSGPEQTRWHSAGNFIAAFLYYHVCRESFTVHFKQSWGQTYCTCQNDIKHLQSTKYVDRYLFNTKKKAP